MDFLRIHMLLADDDAEEAAYLARREAIREALLATRPTLEFKYKRLYYVVTAQVSGGLCFTMRKGKPVKPDRERELVAFLCQPG